MKVALMVALCVFANLAGRTIASSLGAPLFLDTLGTAASAYLMGPAVGCMVGITYNVIYGISHPVTLLYALVSVAVALLVGYSARRKALSSLYGAVCLGCIVAVAGMLLSAPIDYFAFKGHMYNQWGDGIITFLVNAGMPAFFACMIGELYLNFAGKTLVLILLWAGFKAADAYKQRNRVHHIHGESSALSVLLALSLVLTLTPGVSAAQAAESEEVVIKTDYSSYMPVVYGKSNGLLSGTVNAVAQTDDGVLWVGTDEGLYRYAGNGFQHMDKLDSIRNVNALYIDLEGRLWVGTQDSGLAICIDDEVASVLAQDEGLPSNTVESIAMGLDGMYYVGTSAGLTVVTLSGGLAVHSVIHEAVNVRDIAENESGAVAAVSESGTVFLISENTVIGEFSLDEDDEKFTCCAFDGNGVLYVGTSKNKVYRYVKDDLGRRDLAGYETYPELDHINSITFNSQGEAVLCANNGIGIVMADGRFTFLQPEGFADTVEDMLFGYQGNLWFASSEHGLLKLCVSPFVDVFAQAGLSKERTNAIARWQGDYFFATDQGVEAVDKTLTKPLASEVSKKVGSVRVRDLMVDSKGNLWVITALDGVWKFSPQGKSHHFTTKDGLLGGGQRTAIELKDGSIAVAGEQGVSFIGGGKVKSTLGAEDGLTVPNVLCLMQLPDGSGLVGTNGGGLIRIKDGKMVEQLTTHDGLCSNVIARMVPDPQGKGLFVVTSNGLCYVDDQGNVRELTNFPYYNNYDVIAGPQNKLFIPGSAGVYVVDRDELLSGEEINPILLDVNRGLRSDLTSHSWSYKDDEGNLFLAADDGAVMLNLGRYDVECRSYRMNVELQADGEPFNLVIGEENVLPHAYERLIMIPEIMNYTVNDPTVSLFMEGFDTEPRFYEWSDLDRVIYTNLPPGSYVFKIGLQDMNGTTLVENSYPLEISKAIYDEPWFWAYIAVVTVLMIVCVSWIIFRLRFKRVYELQKRELELANQQIQMGNEAIVAIARTVDAKDSNTSEHSYRVAEYAVKIGERMGLSEDECTVLKRTALLHDIGKIGIPDAVLNKPGRLTDEEYEIMKRHVLKGADILQDFTLIDHVIEGARYHHERYDGNGYCEGLKGEEIPLFARIIGVADAFDAMTSNRVYRGQLDLDYVLGELRRCRGTQFDPQAADTLLELIEDGTVDVESLYADSLGKNLADAEKGEEGQ